MHACMCAPAAQRVVREGTRGGPVCCRANHPQCLPDRSRPGTVVSSTGTHAYLARCFCGGGLGCLARLGRFACFGRPGGHGRFVVCTERYGDEGAGQDHLRHANMGSGHGGAHERLASGRHAHACAQTRCRLGGPPRPGTRSLPARSSARGRVASLTMQHTPSGTTRVAGAQRHTAVPAPSWQTWLKWVVGRRGVVGGGGCQLVHMQRAGRAMDARMGWGLGEGRCVVICRKRGPSVGELPQRCLRSRSGPRIIMKLARSQQ